MLWIFLATAVIGITTGLRFQIPLLAVSAILLSVATGGAGVHLGWPVSDTMITILGVLAVQQGSYLIGLSVTCHRQAPRSAKTRYPVKEK